MEAAGIEVATTQVGDRYVLEALLERGWVLGGEQSGHIIDLGFAPSGDGIAGALLILEALEGSDLADRDAMERLPQRLRQRAGARPRRARGDRARSGRPSSARRSALAGRGRVLVRPSGTEPLVRVMVEAPTASREVRRGRGVGSRKPWLGRRRSSPLERTVLAGPSAMPRRPA